MIKEFLLPEKEGEPYIVRSIFLILVAIYSIQFFTFGINDSVMYSFLHGPNLIFHEAGHVIFMPFWEFIGILGWTLGQCLMPIIVGFVFFFKESNPFWASIALWWLGQNLTDVALYISDAWARSLPLIGGMSEEAHDWGNLLYHDGSPWIWLHSWNYCTLYRHDTHAPRARVVRIYYGGEDEGEEIN
jgi:hypothetical protein